MTLTFGKHKGMPIDQVPIPYLQWCVSGKCEYIESHPWIKAEILEELARHGHGPGAASADGHATASAANTKEAFKGVINRTWRRLAPMYHPDVKQGDHERLIATKQMIAINTFKDELMNEIEANPTT